MVPFITTTYVRIAMPKNCSADVHAAVAYADKILTSGSELEVSLLKRAAFFALIANSIQNTTVTRLQNDVPLTPEKLTDWNIAVVLIYIFHSRPFFQLVGYDLSLGDFCNSPGVLEPIKFPRLQYFVTALYLVKQLR